LPPHPIILILKATGGEGTWVCQLKSQFIAIKVYLNHLDNLWEFPSYCTTLEMFTKEWCQGVKTKK